MSYAVYWIAGSPYSWRVMLAMEIKGLEYESRLLQASKKEHQAPAFLQLNPRGRVPVLTDGNKTLYESVAILTYLERKHPEPALFGPSLDETSHVWQTIFEIENYIRDPVLAVVRPIYSEQAAEKLAEIEAAVKTVAEEFKAIDSTLANSDYLNGNSISAADVILFPMVMSLQRALMLEAGAALALDFIPYENYYRNISNWVRRIEAIPGYSKSYPPNWLK